MSPASHLWLLPFTVFLSMERIFLPLPPDTIPHSSSSRPPHYSLPHILYARAWPTKFSRPQTFSFLEELNLTLSPRLVTILSPQTHHTNSPKTDRPLLSWTQLRLNPPLMIKILLHRDQNTPPPDTPHTYYWPKVIHSDHHQSPAEIKLPQAQYLATHLQPMPTNHVWALLTCSWHL